MNDERFMAELLGDTARTPDPRFRLDVFARIAERGRRREAAERAALQVAVFTGLGLMARVAQTAGFSQEAAMPVLMTGAILAAAGAFAWTIAAGPKRVLARLNLS